MGWRAEIEANGRKVTVDGGGPQTSLSGVQLTGWWSTPDGKWSLTERAAGDGAFDVADDSILYSSRTVELSMWAVGGRSDQIDQMRAVLATAHNNVKLRVIDDVSDTYVTGLATVSDDAGSVLSDHQGITLTLSCPDPRRLSTAAHTTYLNPPRSESMGGLSFDIPATRSLHPLTAAPTDGYLWAGDSPSPSITSLGDGWVRVQSGEALSGMLSTAAQAVKSASGYTVLAEMRNVRTAPTSLRVGLGGVPEQTTGGVTTAGRNLARAGRLSGIFNRLSPYEFSIASAGDYTMAGYSLGGLGWAMTPGARVSISADLRYTRGIANVSCLVLTESQRFIHGIHGILGAGLFDAYGRMSATFDLDAGSSADDWAGGKFRFDNAGVAEGAEGPSVLYVRNAKLELGPAPTPWAPAPEDLTWAEVPVTDGTARVTLAPPDGIDAAPWVEMAGECDMELRLSVYEGDYEGDYAAYDGRRHGGGGLLLPLDYGDAAEGVQSYGTVSNSGSSRAYPVITVNGPFSGIRLDFTSDAGTQSLVYDGSIGGVPLVLDSRERRATIGGLDVSQRLSERGFPVIEPYSSIAVSLQSAGTGYVEVLSRDTYI